MLKVIAMLLPTALTKQQEIAAAVDAVATELQPHVRHIWWEIGNDWTGDSAIFFRIVLSDAASRGSRLPRTTDEVRNRLRERVRPQEIGLIAYYSFRSQSEQAKLKEEAWT